MKKSLSRIITLTERNIKEIVRDPLSLIFIIALPLVMEILFYYIFHNLTEQFRMKYLAPGIIVFSQSFITLFIGMLIATDRSTSFLTRLFVTKARASEFILSYLFSVLPIVFTQGILFYLVGGIIDVTLFGTGMLFSFLLSFVTSFLFIGFGILLGSLCNERSIGGVSSLIIAGQSVLSGMWFPTEGLNKNIITAMSVLPFKNATALVQNALNGIKDVWSDFALPFIIIVAYTTVIFFIAILIFKRKMKSR